MIKCSEDSIRESILNVADLMATAAITAPKGSGRDTIVTAIVTGEDKDKLSQALLKMATKYDEAFMIRDAKQIKDVSCVVLIGCKDTFYGLSNCSMCGFENCGKTKGLGSNCVFNVTDLGIAVGSAVSIAADFRIDNRVMYSAGRAAVKLGLLGDNVKLCYGIPLNASSKSIFFDRNPGAVLKK